MAIDSIRVASYVALVIYVWDWFSKLKAEYHFLWSHPFNELNAIRILYIFTRYSPFLCHAVILALLHYKEQHKPQVPVHICHYWFLFIIVSVSWTFGLLLVNLMLRVYALYKLDSRVIFTLAFLLFIKVANVLVSWLLFLPRLYYNPVCLPLIDEPFKMIGFTVIELIIQAIPVYLTLSQGAQVERAARARRIARLVASLRREGVFSWTAVTVFSTIVLSIMVQPRNAPNTFPQIAHPIFTTFISILGCHLILQVREPIVDPDTTSSTSASDQVSFELDSIWDTHTFGPEIEASVPENCT